jgi:acyl-CoA thioester hydrolase
VVARMKLDFKTPLRYDDRFVSRLALTKEGVKYVFHQEIYRESDMTLCFRGDITLVCLINGQLARTSAYDDAFKQFVKA